MPEIRGHFGLQVAEQEQPGGDRKRDNEQHLHISGNEEQIFYLLRLCTGIAAHEQLHRKREQQPQGVYNSNPAVLADILADHTAIKEVSAARHTRHPPFHK
ncbi:hypothetical protein D3C81_2053670 [compost metagenome]